MSALFVPKAAAAQAIPHTPAVPASTLAATLSPSAASVAAGEQAPMPSPATKLKALTVKLDVSTYQRLRRYCAAEEDRTGDRVTHQEVMVEALLRLLNSNK